MGYNDSMKRVKGLLKQPSTPKLEEKEAPSGVSASPKRKPGRPKKKEKKK